MPRRRNSQSKKVERKGNSNNDNSNNESSSSEHHVDLWAVIVSEAVNQESLQARLKAQEYLNEKYSALFSPRVAG